MIGNYRSSSPTEARLEWLEVAAPSARRRARYLRLARLGRQDAETADGCDPRGSAPVRDRRRQPLRQGRGRDGAPGRRCATQRRHAVPGATARCGCSPTGRRICAITTCYVNTGSLEELDSGFVAGVVPRAFALCALSGEPHGSTVRLFWECLLVGVVVALAESACQRTRRSAGLRPATALSAQGTGRSSAGTPASSTSTRRALLRGE